MGKQIEKLELLKKCLNKIGWDIKGNSRMTHIYNHLNEQTCWEIRSDRIELCPDDIFGKKISEYGNGGAVCFHFKDCTIEMVADDCVSIGVGEGAYVLFYNHSEKK